MNIADPPRVLSRSTSIPEAEPVPASVVAVDRAVTDTDEVPPNMTAVEVAPVIVPPVDTLPFPSMENELGVPPTTVSVAKAPMPGVVVPMGGGAENRLVVVSQKAPVLGFSKRMFGPAAVAPASRVAAPAVPPTMKSPAAVIGFPKLAGQLVPPERHTAEPPMVVPAASVVVEVELSVVNLPAAAVVCPTVVPLIAPPVIATLLAF